MYQYHLLAILFSVIGAFFLFQAIAYFRRSIVRPMVQGVVVRMNRDLSGGGPNRRHSYNYAYAVEYTKDDQAYCVTIGTGSGVFPHYAMGSRVWLILDERSSDRAEFYTKQEIALRVGLFLLGLTFFAIAVLVWLAMNGIIEVQPVDESRIGILVCSCSSGVFGAGQDPAR